jgi:formimidoylglutamate deiminase
MQRLWFSQARLNGGWATDVRLTLSGGSIESVEAGVPATAEDERHGIAIPGLCNVHSHGFQRGMAGLSERRGRPDDDFWSWREVMYRFLERMTPDDIAAITALAYAEMLESGYTRVGEFHYLHNDVGGGRYVDPAETAGSIVSASAETGIGLTLIPVFYAHADFGGAPPAPGQRRFISDIDGFARLMDASRAKLRKGDVIGIAPHSLRAVTPEELAAILPLAQDGPIHIHAAEQTKEVHACRAWSGARPVEWLLENAPVDERWCLIHATHIDDAEVMGLGASGAVAGLCPVTEANLGDGVFPADAYLCLEGRIGTGTDSNILVDAAGELRMIEYSQRLHHRRRNILGCEETPSVGERLFGATLVGGAQALGVKCGLAAGMPADIVALDACHPAFAAREGDMILDSWIFAGGAGCVDSVWAGGVRQVKDGRHVAREAIAARYAVALERLTA